MGEKDLGGNVEKIYRKKPCLNGFLQGLKFYFGDTYLGHIKK